jgi:cytochrome c551
VSNRSLKFISLFGSTIAFLISVFACSSNSNKPDTTSVKFTQYYVKGEELYLKHCSNCHQKNGTGLGLVFPPLNTSDYMDKNFEKVLCIMKYGIKEEIIVNGKSFVQPMSGVATLTNLEIAEIATYIYNSWSHARGIVDVTEADNVMKACATSN